MNNIQYRIATGQSYGKWCFVIKKYMRVTFKRSRRVGWRWVGFVKHPGETTRFDTRAEALAAAKTVKNAVSEAK